MSETPAVENDAGRLTEREREMLYAPDRRMDAYYYSFDPTGVPEIDAILSAVAHAGKGYHHTEGWTDTDEWGRWGPDRSLVDVIQAAANEAALGWRTRVIPPAKCPECGGDLSDGVCPNDAYQRRVIPPAKGNRS